MFILTNERHADVDGAFARYKDYLKANRHRFPPAAYSLASSGWYFGFSDHQAPHDSWLELLSISEPSNGQRSEIRTVSITLKLLGAYHDGYIELHYPTVFEYRLDGITLGRGHGDWRYDEFRLNENDQVVHEVEWTSVGASNTWLIVASDVHHKWLPFK